MNNWYSKSFCLESGGSLSPCWPVAINRHIPPWDGPTHWFLNFYSEVGNHLILCEDMIPRITLLPGTEGNFFYLSLAVLFKDCREPHGCLHRVPPTSEWLKNSAQNPLPIFDHDQSTASTSTAHYVTNLNCVCVCVMYNSMDNLMQNIMKQTTLK